MTNDPRFFFIVNPNAGKRTGPWRSFEKLWAGRNAAVRFTERRGHASDLASEALRAGFERVVAVGGDGTLSEAAHGLLRLGPIPEGFALAHLPTGSGCDVARHFGLPLRPRDWAAYLERGETARIDAGKASWTEEDASCERFFINIAMAGIAGDIAHAMEKTGKPLGGTASYLAVSLAHLLKDRAKPISLSMDGNIQPPSDYHLLAVANTSTTGGGMRIAPRADARDGLLDFVAVRAMGKPRLLWSFPKIYAGTHLSVPGVESRRLAKLGATSSVLVRLNIDGEPLGRLPARFEVCPKALPMLLCSP